MAAGDYASLCAYYTNLLGEYGLSLQTNNSASDSLIFFGTLPTTTSGVKTDIVIKMFVAHLKNQGMVYELGVYNEIATKIFPRNPSFIKLVSTLNLDINVMRHCLELGYPLNLEENARDVVHKYINNSYAMVNHLQKSNPNPWTPKYENKIIGIVTEKAEGRTLQDIISAQPPQEFEILFDDIFFELFMALHCLNAHDITHNDIHFGNIFVQILPIPVVRLYSTDNSSVWVNQSRVRLQIYDWDRSYAESIGVNNVLVPRSRKAGEFDPCLHSGQCNTTAYPVNYVKVLWLLMINYSGGNQIIDKKINTWLNIPEYMKTIVHLSKLSSIPSGSLVIGTRYGQIPAAMWKIIGHNRLLNRILKYPTLDLMLHNGFAGNKLHMGNVHLLKDPSARMWISDPQVQNPEAMAQIQLQQLRRRYVR